MLLSEARKMSDAVRQAAEAADVAAGIAVVDEYGSPLQLDRMDGAPPMATDVAIAKALTALNFQCPTEALGESLMKEQLDHIVNFEIVTIPGGAPIIEGNRTIGAVGVCSASAREDGILAAKGVSAR